jgi:polar amino acid transport system permease protein
MNRTMKPLLLSLQSQKSKERIWNASVLLLLAWAAWQARDLRWEVVVDTAPYLLKGLGRSWILAFLSVGLGGVIALLLAAGRVYGPFGIRHLCVLIIEVVRATPELMIIFWIYFTYPAVIGHAISNWWAAVAALTLMAAAYLAEVIRGGIYSVPNAQREAGIASGLTEYQAFWYIILPQAVRNMVPAFIAQLVMLFKTTSLVYVIGVIEYFRAIILINNALFAPFALYLTMGFGYFICCYFLSWVIRRLDPKYLLVE